VRRLFAVAGLVVAAVLSAVSHDVALGRRAAMPAESDALYLPRASALHTMTLGHHELGADLVFIRAIIYFGGQFHAKREYRWLENYLDTIVALDPEWRTPYRWAGVATMYDGRTITNESVLASNHFLEKGVKQFPDDWELSFMLGCNYIFELKTDDPAQRSRWRLLGADYIQHAALVGGPPWIPLLAATVLNDEGEGPAAIRHLEQVYASTQSASTRQEVRNRLLSLHAKVDFVEAERARAEFEAGWRKTVPYAPADFFAVLGPPMPPIALP